MATHRRARSIICSPLPVSEENARDAEGLVQKKMVALKGIRRYNTTADDRGITGERDVRWDEKRGRVLDRKSDLSGKHSLRLGSAKHTISRRGELEPRQRTLFRNQPCCSQLNLHIVELQRGEKTRTSSGVWKKSSMGQVVGADKTGKSQDD